MPPCQAQVALESVLARRPGSCLPGHLPSLDGAIALSSHSRLVEVTELKELRDRLSEPWAELGRRSSKSSRC